MININKITSQIQETFHASRNNRLLIIFGILWLFITLTISYFSYNSYIKPLINEHKLNNEFVNKNIDSNDEDILVMYFYTDWCPYCKRAEPEWKQFKNYVDNKNNNKNKDYTINVVSINCDENKKMADKYEIEGYPTIKLIYKKKVYDYDAKVTKDNLVEFVNSIK